MFRLNPKVKVRHRKFYRRKIFELFVEQRDNLKTQLKAASWVCTTADCWSSRRKSFLGITVHWYNSDLERKSACLAVRRVIGKCDYEVIARLLESVYEEFEITSKVSATVTDNGSNFLKAFRLFGTQDDVAVTSTSEVNLNNKSINFKIIILFYFLRRKELRISSFQSGQHQLLRQLRQLFLRVQILL